MKWLEVMKVRIGVLPCNGGFLGFLSPEASQIAYAINGDTTKLAMVVQREDEMLDFARSNSEGAVLVEIAQAYVLRPTEMDEREASLRELAKSWSYAITHELI